MHGRRSYTSPCPRSRERAGAQGVSEKTVTGERARPLFYTAGCPLAVYDTQGIDPTGSLRLLENHRPARASEGVTYSPLRLGQHLLHGGPDGRVAEVRWELEYQGCVLVQRRAPPRVEGVEDHIVREADPFIDPRGEPRHRHGGPERAGDLPALHDRRRDDYGTRPGGLAHNQAAVHIFTIQERGEVRPVLEAASCTIFFDGEIGAVRPRIHTAAALDTPRA